MTKQEKIEYIAGLININAPKQNITDYKFSDEELHIRTLNELEKLTDNELDIIIDKVWNEIKTIMEYTSLPKTLF